MEKILSEIINKLELYCIENNIEHRFVGSVSFGGLLNEKTKYVIDFNKKKVYLKNHNPLSLLRTDNTIKDIDLILFCADGKKTKNLKEFIEKEKKLYNQYPLVSIEATVYPTLAKRNPLLQFVTGLEVDSKKQLFLTFDEIKQKITWQSVEPWQVILENKMKYTTRNPIADYYAYHFRSPSGIKPKDKKKIVILRKLSDTVINEGKKHKIDYESDDYFGTWKLYSKQLEQTRDPRIVLKKTIITMYWNTIGTYIAHGKGLGKVFLSLSNQFTGIKQ